MTTKNKALIISLFIVTLISFFVQSYDYDYTLDDLEYQFVFSDESDNEDIEHMKIVDSFSDVLTSQLWHYQHVNGRAPAHILIQLFYGVFPNILYPIINTICFLIAVLLFSRYIARPTSKWVYLYVILSMTYLFPKVTISSTPWYHAVGSLNYLWPATLLMLIITILSNNYHDKNCTRWYHYLLFSLMGIFVGWSNEAFSIPLSGALLFYMIITRKRLHGLLLVMTIAIWVGTAILVFAPGTINRATHQLDNGVRQMFITLFNCYYYLKFLWILLILLPVTKIFKDFSLKHFFQDNLMCSLILCIGIVFSIYAHSYAQSLTCIELMSMILVAKLLVILCDGIKRNHIYSVAYLFILILFGTHQYFICKADHLALNLYHESEQRYRKSPDGVFEFCKPDFSNIIKPFVTDYSVPLEPTKYIATEFSIVNGCPGKLPLELTHREFNGIIMNPEDFFIEKNRVPGNANLYKGDNFYFTRLDSVFDNHTSFIIYYNSTDFLDEISLTRRLLYKIIGNKKAPIRLTPFEVNTRSGKYLVAYKFPYTPSSIEIE